MLNLEETRATGTLNLVIARLIARFSKRVNPGLPRATSPRAVATISLTNPSTSLPWRVFCM